MKILFVARAFDRMAGGVERMIITIANEMSARGHHVAIFTWDVAGAEAFYKIEASVTWLKLDMGSPASKATTRSRLERMIQVRKMVSGFNPECIVCFQGGPFIAMRAFTVGMGIPVIAAERTAPTLYRFVSTARHQSLERMAFRTASLITVQFERYRDLYPSYLRRKIVAIPNPVPQALKLASPSEAAPSGRLRLLAVGRLSYQKNFEVLIEAFAALADEFSQWDLRIVGEGEHRQKLETMIAAHPGLAGRVALPGASSDIAVEYLAAHLFCLPSRWEGFPNALAEAMAHGLPSVGFAECAGVADLIEDGQSGALADGTDDVRSLSKALRTFLGSQALRAAAGQRAAASMKKYETGKIFDLWENTIRSLKRG